MAYHPFATMISSRGCPFQCSFCFKQFFDKKSMFRTPEDVVNEMQYLVEVLGVREIMFYDDIFTMKQSRVFEICDLIRSRNLKVRWEVPTRIDLVTEKMLSAMAEAGCVRIRFGIESGDPGILAIMKKHSDIQLIEKAVRETKNAGIETFGYFIVGYLHETLQQFENTINLATRIPLDYASFYTATPLPGTGLHEDAVKSGAIPADYWSRYVRGEAIERIPFLVPEGEERAREAYRRFYFRPSHFTKVLRSAFKRNALLPVLGGMSTLIRARTNFSRDT
jgi:radical SAM superfamily enzyme YgiQ (UPF0313 family)